MTFQVSFWVMSGCFNVSRVSAKSLNENEVTKILEIFPKNVGKLLYIYTRTRGFEGSGRGKKHTLSNEKLYRTHFYSVNTRRNLTITTVSEQFVNEGRKKA